MLPSLSALHSLLLKAANASASADAEPARLPPINSLFAGKVWLKNRAVGIRLHAVVSPPFALKVMPINADYERLAFFVCD
jgi:hypothetical protein